MIEEHPPEYSAPLDPRFHLTEEERAQAFRQWAEEKLHVRPGEDGTLPAGPGGVVSLAIGGMSTVKSSHDRQLPPPSYHTVTNARTEGSESRGKGKGTEAGAVKRWLIKRKEKKEERRQSQG